MFPDERATVFGESARVDVYNASSNSWTSYPTGLREARGRLVSTSLPSGLVFFAGGRIRSGTLRI
jgi:hypothetical protein